MFVGMRCLRLELGEECLDTSVTEAEKNGAILVDSVLKKVAVQVPSYPIEATLIHVNIFEAAKE